MIFLLLVLGILVIVGAFLTPGWVGIALAVVGGALLWVATVAALKHIGWF